MNIGEANDLNAVLRALLAPPVDGSAMDVDRVEAAAARLIERANKTLGTGMTPVDVRFKFAAWVARRREILSEPKVQIIHSRDPDSECGLTVFVNGVKVDFTEEDIDPGRGYDEDSIQERRDEAKARASRPDATDFDKAVAAELDEARFERFAL